MALDKKKLLIDTLNSDDVEHVHVNKITNAHITELADGYYRVQTSRPGKDGKPDDKIISEFQVWTDEEAAANEYLRGGIQTSNSNYKIYRTA